jgi:8-oxo-dGTP pyrophosphatase MutT (NUDIX family)
MAHIHDKIDFTTEVFVVFENKVLLRKHDKYKMWLGVGGHIELDEDPNQAAIREVKEEVGLDVEIVGETPPVHEEEGYIELIAPRALNRHRINETHEHISFIYYAKSRSDEVVPEKEDDEWKWLSREDIENELVLLKGDVRFHALQALEQLSE